MFDGETFGAQMVEIVRDSMARATAPLLERIAALEAREAEKGDPGEPGRDGRDIEDIVLKQNGRDVEWAFTFGDTKTVYEMELPEGLPGKDGPGFVDALIDGDGALVLTRSDGTTARLGIIKGQDGKDGIGFAGAFEDDGKFIVRFTDGSEMTLPLPQMPELPDMEPPTETCEYVAKALRVFAELPEARIEPAHAPEPAKQLPIVLNVNAGGIQAPPKMVKSITTRRDGSGNLVADIVERPDI